MDVRKLLTIMIIVSFFLYHANLQCRVFKNVIWKVIQ